MAMPTKDRPAALKLVLSGEDCGTVSSPNLDDTLYLLFELDPADGTGFACLAEIGDFGDYVQVVGGYDPEANDKRYCVERRIYARSHDDRVVSPYDYDHLIAGHRHDGAATETSVKTNGFKVDCRTNEVLFLEDVIDIFQAFMQARDLPRDYEWRSNRAEVDLIGKSHAN